MNKIQVDNLLKGFKKAKFIDLGGLEVLALSQAITALHKLGEEMDAVQKEKEEREREEEERQPKKKTKKKVK